MRLSLSQLLELMGLDDLNGRLSGIQIVTKEYEKQPLFNTNWQWKISLPFICIAIFRHVSSPKNIALKLN